MLCKLSSCSTYMILAFLFAIFLFIVFYIVVYLLVLYHTYKNNTNDLKEWRKDQKSSITDSINKKLSSL
jgi:heme/copper-type cytochrome/quinol oxidase subunit 2